MISRIIDFSSRNRLVVGMFVLILFLWGYWSLYNTPLDALPDLSDTQVIVYTDWVGRSPDLVEDQITYPIVTTLLAAPKVKVVRGFSYLGSSFIYVIFEDGTDIYWARSRVLEYLQSVRSKIPREVSPVLGPDASSVGWGFSYALVDDTGKQDLSKLRTIQDWNIKLALESVPGVSQVASIGGFVKQYQVTIDPDSLSAYDIPITKVMGAIRRNNRDVEGRVIEFSGIEYMVRGKGYVNDIHDLEKIVVGTDGEGTPVTLKNIARITIGPEIRRGVADLDGKGEVAGGIVVVRFGENVLNVIKRVKEKIHSDIEPGLPEGVRVVVTYDRSDLIYRSIDTLRDEIIKLSLAVGIVCLVFLFHLPSALVIILTLPVAIIISFICMYYLGVTSNIMSLGGIAIAIGAMVDASIVMVENAHKRLEEWESDGSEGDRTTVIINAAKEVGPSLFFSLLVITVAFLPVFTLQSQAGRLFKPLAYTKTFAMLFASFLAITLTPILMTFFIRGTVRPEEKNPVSTFLYRIYEPTVLWAMRHKWKVLVAAVIIVVITVIPFVMTGSEFMPPLFEGSLFYMPVTMPGASIGTVSGMLQAQDRLFMEIPEVSSVFGKAGRADTATDPAPLEMFETVINLKPEHEWRPGMTVNRLIGEMDRKLSLPGTVNSFTSPIKARIDMLSTGIRTPLGLKITGPDLATVEDIGLEVEKVLNEMRETRSVYAERVNTGYFLDIDINRDEIARYGLAIDDVNDVVKSALGGINLTTTIEGRERYPVNIRYPRELRDNLKNLKRIYVPARMSMEGRYGNRQYAQIPLGQLADIDIVKGPSVIKSEEGMPASYVYIDTMKGDLDGYVEKARKELASLTVPRGYKVEWSGEYEYLQKTKEGLKIAIPFTLLIIFLLLFLNTRSIPKTLIVLLAVPFSLAGSFWFIYLLGYHMSTAVWIGIIALAGLDAETGVVMLLYLDLAYDRWSREGRMNSIADIRESVLFGAVKRVRPKIMTVSVILAGLVPIMFSTGIGSDVMKRIAAPMIGGVVTSALLELLIYPIVFIIWKEKKLFSGKGLQG